MIPPFATVLLTGGRSRRMGRDKALLPLGDGRLLWQRQLDVLRELEPDELFISGPEREGFPASITRLDDTVTGQGPLGGIAAALRTMRSARLAVLAVDLPAMTADFLRGLLVDNQGMVPRMSDGFFEPLAAVYPQTALAVAEGQLDSADRSLQTFVRHLVAEGKVAVHTVADEERVLFTNWNRPDNFPPET